MESVVKPPKFLGQPLASGYSIEIENPFTSREMDSFNTRIRAKTNSLPETHSVSYRLTQTQFDEFYDWFESGISQTEIFDLDISGTSLPSLIVEGSYSGEQLQDLTWKISFKILRYAALRDYSYLIKKTLPPNLQTITHPAPVLQYLQQDSAVEVGATSGTVISARVAFPSNNGYAIGDKAVIAWGSLVFHTLTVEDIEAGFVDVVVTSSATDGTYSMFAYITRGAYDFTPHSNTIKVIVDNSAPYIQFAFVASDVLTLTIADGAGSSPLNGTTVPLLSAFALSASAGSVSLRYCTLDAVGRVLRIKLSRFIGPAETCTLSYSSPMWGLQDMAGNKVPAVSNMAIQNDSVTAQPYSVLIAQAELVKAAYENGLTVNSFPLPPSNFGPGAVGTLGYRWAVGTAGGLYAILYDVHAGAAADFSIESVHTATLLNYASAGAVSGYPYAGNADGLGYFVLVPFAWIDAGKTPMPF